MDIVALRTDARYQVSPQLTSADYADTDVDRNLNRWYRLAMAWAIKSQGDFEINGDILTQDLQVGVTDYYFPSNLISIYKAEIMYTTGGKFVPLTPISVQRNTGFVEGNSSRTFDDPTNPTMEFFGDIMQVKPAPTANVVNGLMIWAQTDFVDLDAATNNIPDLLECVQRVLSYGAAQDFCLANDMYTKATELKRFIYGDTRLPEDGGLKAVIEDMYSMKDDTRRDRVQAKRRSYK